MRPNAANTLAPHILPEIFTTGECESVISAIAQAPLRDALLVGRAKNPEQRTAQLVWLDEVGGLSWVMEQLIEVIRDANRDQFDFDLKEFAESCQVAVYRSSDAGHFAWHSDIGGGPTSRRRKLTLVVQLSKADAYTGGDLQIMPSAQVLSVSRTQGCASIFPSFMLHQVTPVTSGIRYSMTVWAHGPNFR